jgi:hypothetical protein
MSATDFAEEISISENGIVWVLSTQPDPQSGSYLYWGAGDGNWKPVGNVPGVVQLTGAGPDIAVFYTEDGSVWVINTNGSSSLLTKIQDVQEMDYGGNNLWAVFPTIPGGKPCLQFWNVMVTPANWVVFEGALEPMGISGNYNGDCYGALDYSPVYFSGDGKTTGSGGSGAKGSTLALTFKNTYYLLSTVADKNGNEVMIWVDEMGGNFVNAGFQAIQVLGSYYLGS